MSITKGIDVSPKGTIDVCKVSLWTGVPETAWRNFLYNRIDPSGTPTESERATVDDYGWGGSMNYIAVKYVHLFIPLITGGWQIGIPSEDDKCVLRMWEGDFYGKAILYFDGDSHTYYPVWLVAGRPYLMEHRWYELVGPGNYDPRFIYPGDSTGRVIQSTADVCQIRLYDGTIDNTPLLSVVL